MIELGFSLKYFENNNIIILLNDKISKEIPSILSGFDITYYNSDSKDYYLDIIDKIINDITNLYDKKEWTYFNYLLSNKFITSLQ